MDVKIIDPITHYIKEFDTPNDFDSWYKSHQKELDKLTTHKLNKMIHINGYRITRIKGVFSLKKVPQKSLPKDDVITDNSENEQRFIAIENEISDMSEGIKNIKIMLKSIENNFSNLKGVIIELMFRHRQSLELRDMDESRDTHSSTTGYSHIFYKNHRNID